MSKLRSGLVAALIGAIFGAALVVVALRASDAGGGIDPVARASTTTSSATTSSTVPSTTEAPTTTVAPPIIWPGLDDGAGAPRAVTTPNGVVLAVLAAQGDGRFLARSPCGNEVTVSGLPLSGATVVLDPGHGGEEPGAVGPNGLREKDVNLAIASMAEEILEAEGANVVLTRTGDYRITLASRGDIVQALQPAMFISIHHNAEPDEMRPTPGAETYYQIASSDSKRAAGLVYEELYGAFDDYAIQWGADRDAGAKYRPNSEGGDYYGILKRTAGIPAVLSEAAFISNPAEEALLADPAFQRVEAQALARAAVRFITTDDPGTGYVEPYPRTQPAGGGGGAAGCVDPPLS